MEHVLATLEIEADPKRASRQPSAHGPVQKGLANAFRRNLDLMERTR